MSYITAAHDAILPPDARTTLRVNYQWREWITNSIEWHRDAIIEDLDEPQLSQLVNWFDDMIDDLYS